jgi:hypothetical protein
MKQNILPGWRYFFSIFFTETITGVQLFYRVCEVIVV